MICRLCLKKLNLQISVHLFDVSGNISQVELKKMIFKYFNLEISLDDFSTAICEDCSQHLEDFHKFSTNVEQKQFELRQQQEYEFFEIKCEEAVALENINVDESLINLPSINADVDCILETNGDCLEKNILRDKSIAESKTSEYFVKYEDHNENSSNDGDGDDRHADNNLLNGDDEIPLMSLRSKWKYSDTQPSKKDKVSKTKNNFDKFHGNFADPTKKLKLTCDLCKEKIGSFKQLQKHFCEQHVETKAYVTCCGRKYTQERYLENHFEKHRNPESFKCHKCDKLMSSKKYLKIHLRINHAENKNLSCKVCGKMFSHQKRLSNHLHYHKSVESKTLNCSICNKSYTTIYRLNRHIQGTHENFYPYKCSACNKPFNFKSEVDLHYENCKNKSLINRLSTGEVAKEEEKYTKDCICNICNKIFMNPRQVIRHIDSIHKNIHPHICDQCGKKFKFKPAFEKHLREHAGLVDPPAQCNICGNWLKNQHTLRLHLYRHDGSVNKCHLCEKLCASRRALRGHIQNVHRNEKNFKCNYCDKSFKSPKNLKEHIATHTGVQLYSCPHCNKETRSNSNMYVHIKRAHPEEWTKSRTAKSYDPHINTTTTNE